MDGHFQEPSPLKFENPFFGQKKLNLTAFKGRFNQENDIMEIEINQYIQSLNGSKGAEIQALHNRILQANPDIYLWFLDGKDSNNKVVSNPNIGYGKLTMKYADGSSREFYKVGLSATATGISVYIMGLKDKNQLQNQYGAALGKAKITGYCIKFKSLRDIDEAVLFEAISFGLNHT